MNANSSRTSSRAFTQLGAWAQTQLWHNASCCSSKQKHRLIAFNNTLFSRCQWRWPFTAARGVSHQHSCSGDMLDGLCPGGWQQQLWEAGFTVIIPFLINNLLMLHVLIALFLCLFFSVQLKCNFYMLSPTLAFIFSMPFILCTHIWIQCMS